MFSRVSLLSLYEPEESNPLTLMYCHGTEWWCHVLGIPAQYSRRPGFNSRSGGCLSWQVSRDIRQSLQTSALIVPQIRRRPLPSKSFLVHCPSHHTFRRYSVLILTWSLNTCVGELVLRRIVVIFLDKIWILYVSYLEQGVYNVLSASCVRLAVLFFFLDCEPLVILFIKMCIILNIGTSVLLLVSRRKETGQGPC
jgi:hypothetical protein